MSKGRDHLTTNRPMSIKKLGPDQDRASRAGGRRAKLISKLLKMQGPCSGSSNPSPCPKVKNKKERKGETSQEDAGVFLLFL